MTDNKWARLLAYVTGLVNQKLLLQNEYLAAENRILRAHLPARLRLSDPQRSTLAEIGKRLGRTALQQVACVAKPETILAWYRRLIARKFDGSKFRTSPGRPRIAPEVEALMVRFARENCGWGYDRIVGALANLGHAVSDQTVGNILRRYGIQPAPRRSQNTTWKDFIASHLAVLAGTDFFTVEVLTWRGLTTYYVLFFIHLESRRVSLAGLTRHPTSEHYCPRQPRIRRFGQGKPFILNTAPCQPRRRSPSSLRSCPKRIGSRRWAGNASKSGNSGRLRALGESLRPPEPGRRASSPVQKGGG